MKALVIKLWERIPTPAPSVVKDAVEAAVLLSLTLAGGGLIGWAAAKVFILLG